MDWPSFANNILNLIQTIVLAYFAARWRNGVPKSDLKPPNG